MSWHRPYFSRVVDLLPAPGGSQRECGGTMPVYVYRNQVTGETFELEQRITEDALTNDPKTGDPVRRVIQPVGISFKGSGVYVNDSRGASRPKAAVDKPDSGPKDSGSGAAATAAGDAAKPAKPASPASASTD